MQPKVDLGPLLLTSLPPAEIRLPDQRKDHARSARVASQRRRAQGRSRETATVCQAVRARGEVRTGRRGRSPPNFVVCFGGLVTSAASSPAGALRELGAALRRGAAQRTSIKRMGSFEGLQTSLFDSIAARRGHEHGQRVCGEVDQADTLCGWGQGTVDLASQHSELQSNAAGHEGGGQAQGSAEQSDAQRGKHHRGEQQRRDVGESARAPLKQPATGFTLTLDETTVGDTVPSVGGTVPSGSTAPRPPVGTMSQAGTMVLSGTGRAQASHAERAHESLQHEEYLSELDHRVAAMEHEAQLEPQPHLPREVRAHKALKELGARRGWDR